MQEMQTIVSTRLLNDKTAIPVIGFGTAGLGDRFATATAVRTALEAGYRQIDSASKYGNESGVGLGIRNSGIAREDIYLVTKIWNSDIRAHREQEALKDSLRRLGTDYIDLYMIHWPVPGEYLRSWEVLQQMLDSGLVRSIGVCNFQPHHLDSLFRYTRVRPVVNQVECHPLFSQQPLQQYCDRNNIPLICHSPLGGSIGNLTDHERLTGIGIRYGKTAAQVILRWHLQKGRIPIPKSAHPNRIRENTDLFDFNLKAQDVDAIDAMNQNLRIGGNPDTFTF